MAKSNALELSIRIAGKVDSSLTKAIKTAQSQTSGLARGMSGFAKVSAAAIAGVTTATAGIMGYCGKQAAGLEKAMAQTRTLLTGTTEQTAARTAELTQDVMNVSRITGRVSTEIAAGSYQVISAFQDTADTAKILETSVKASIAGQAETVDTVNALAAVTKAYGDTSADAVAHVSDLSFETIRLGQTTMPELANGIQKASGSAAALKVSQEELYAGFATLTGVIGNTDTVGTALNTLYTKMLKPSTALAGAVKKLGYESAYAMVRTEGIGGAIKKLGEYTGGDATRFAALFSMRDLKAAQGILNTMGVYENKLAQLQDLKNQKVGEVTDRAFITSIDNWNDMFGIASNKVQVFAQQIGTRLLPYAKDFMLDITPKLDSMMDTALNGIDKIMPKAEQLFGYLSSNGPQAAGTLGAIASVWAGMAAAPKIEQGIQGIAGLFSVGGRKAVGGGAKLFGKVKGFGESMIGNIKDFRANPGLIQSLPVFGWAQNVKNIPTNAKAAMLQEINNSGSLLKVAGAGLGSVFGRGGLNAGGIAKGAASPFLAMGKVFLGMLGSTAPVILAISTIIALVSLLGDNLDNIRGIVQNTFGDKGVAIFDGFVGVVQNAAGAIQKAFSPEGLASIQGFITETFGAGAGQAFGTFIPLITAVVGIFNQLVDLGVNYIKPLLVDVFSFATTQGLPAVIPLLSAVVGLIGTTLVNAIKVVVGIVQTLLPIAEPVIMGIIGLIKGIVSVTINVVNGIIGALNKIHVQTPDWIPGIGGKTFGFNLAEVPMPQFAKGGFTTGPSIAGEAGTEAVISFQSGVRQQNIDIWKMAGKMLGATNSDDAGDDPPQIVFAPNIVFSSDMDPAEARRKVEELYRLFEVFMERWWKKHRRVAYGK